MLQKGAITYLDWGEGGRSDARQIYISEFAHVWYKYVSIPGALKRPWAGRWGWGGGGGCGRNIVPLQVDICGVNGGGPTHPCTVELCNTSFSL